MTQVQRAVLIRQVGHPVELGSRPVRQPEPDEVLIKVTATMILPHDAYSRDWGMFTEGKLPFVVGNNIAGTVEKVGPGVTDFVPGDRVFGLADISAPNINDQAGLQEYSVLKANAIARTPENFSDDEVVTLPVNVVTAWVALFSKAGFDWASPIVSETTPHDNDTKTIVIIGAGSSVGKFTCQLARAAGVGTVIAIAGIANKEQLRELGVTHTIDRHLSLEDIVSAVHHITSREGATHILDCYNDDLSLARALLPQSAKGWVRTLHPLEENLTHTDNIDMKFVDDIATPLEPQAKQFWAGLPDLLRAGKARPGSYQVVEGLHKVEEINAALDGYMSGKGGAQTIVHP